MPLSADQQVTPFWLLPDQFMHYTVQPTVKGANLNAIAAIRARPKTQV